jgi:carbon-monoxide dehydrogenase small subunit
MTELFRDKVDVSMTVNGEPVEARVPAGQHMIDFLRLELGLTGAHASCEHGVCGACTIRVDGDAVRGCLMLAAQADGAEVWTVEGLTDTSAVRDLQDAFVERNALQCGFCTPGMLVAADELLSRGGVPSRAEIREHLSGNYCRCTGYEAIIDAVESVAQSRAGKGTA